MPVTEKDLRFRMVCHMSLEREHLTKYRDDKYGIIIESSSRVLSGNRFGKPRRIFYFENSPRGKEYKTIKPILSLINAGNSPRP